MAKKEKKKGIKPVKHLQGKLTVVGENSAYSAEGYRVIFKKLPFNEMNPQYSRMIGLLIQKNGKEIVNLVVAREASGVATYSYNYFLELLEISGESFPIRTFNVSPDSMVLGALAIEYVKGYEKEVLNGRTPENFATEKRMIIEYIKNLNQKARFFNFKFCYSNFIFFEYEPDQTYYVHKVGVAYDTENKRYYYLTTDRSLEKFFSTNKNELVGKKNLVVEGNRNLIIKIFSVAAYNSFTYLVLNSSEDILKSPYCSGGVEEEIKIKAEKLKDVVRASNVKDGALTFYVAEKAYPAKIIEYKLMEKGTEFTIKNKVLMENVFMPYFVCSDSISPEEGLNYIR